MGNKRNETIEKMLRNEKPSRARGLLLVAGFLCLGLLSACSNVQREVISNKQASAEARSRTYGRTEGSPSNDRSLWNINYQIN